MVFDLHWLATEVGYCEPGRLDMIRGGIALRSPLRHDGRRLPRSVGAVAGGDGQRSQGGSPGLRLERWPRLSRRGRRW